MPHDLPLTIGAALPVEKLSTYRDWLFDRDRDLEIQSFTMAEVLDGDWRPLAEEARRILDGFKGRLGIHGPFWGFTIDSLDPAIREVVSRRLLQGLDVCDALGATQMVVHSPYNPWLYNNLPLYDGGAEKLIEMCHLTMAPAVKRAEDQGVTLVIENIADKSAQDRIPLIDSFNSPAVKASLDTGHAMLGYGSQLAQPVDYFVKAAGERLDHVHLQDADGYADRHWAIGEGSVPWAAVFRAIAKLETRPRLVLELFDRDAIPQSMTWLQARGLAQ